MAMKTKRKQAQRNYEVFLIFCSGSLVTSGLYAIFSVHDYYGIVNLIGAAILARPYLRDNK
jgi:hypothetical protein